MKTILFFAAVLFLSFTTGTAQTPKTNKSTKPDMVPNMAMVRIKSGYTIADATKVLAGSGARPVHQMLLPEQSIRFNQSVPNAQPNSKTEEILRTEEPVLRTFVVEYDGTMPPERFCTMLMKNNPEIEIAEPRYVYKTLVKPNDRYIGQQDLLTVIKAFDSWEITKGDPSVIIGICDNGIDQAHEDLTNAIAINTGETDNNQKDDDNNGYVDDYKGVNLSWQEDGTQPSDTHISDTHGTCVAGIAGASTNNDTGIAGVGYKCKIFPIKAGRDGHAGVTYGNEGLIYAALRGFKVVNCSWGIENGYSRIQEAIVQYVLSKDVVIVAAAGNNTGTSPWYPAGYTGVLGVGQSDLSDVIGGEAVGSHVGLSAPGVNTIATAKSPNKYDFNFGGSSAATPVVSGVVAIVRSYHPELTGRQAAEVTRLSGDNIEAVNPSVAGIAARRVNMLKAVTRDPFSSPSIRPKDFKYYVRNEEAHRFSVGDTVTAIINGFNYLGASSNVSFTTSVPDLFPFFKLIDSVGTIPVVNPNSDVEVPRFKFVVTNESTELKFIRVDMKSSNYDDYFLLPIIPVSDIATFENDSLRFSLGDAGSFGYSRNGVDWAGVGLDYKKGGNLIFSTSPGTQNPDHVLILTEDNAKLITSNVSGSFFTSEKNFVYPEPNRGIINDSSLSEADKIGVKVQRDVTMIPGLPAAKIKFTITNVSGKTLKNIALGYYLDWDIGEYGSYNAARSFTEAIPAGLSNNAAAEIISRDGGIKIGTDLKPYPVSGWLVSSNNPTAQPQMAAVSVAEFIPGDFSDQKKIQLLNSGTSLQTDKKTDIGMAAGMKFSGDFPVNETRTFDLYIGAAMSEADLASTLKASVLFNSVESEKPTVAHSDWVVTPNPARDEIILTGNGNGSSHIVLYSMIGEIISEFQIDGNMAHIPTAQLPTGVYALHIQTGEKHTQQTVVIVH